MWNYLVYTVHVEESRCHPTHNVTFSQREYQERNTHWNLQVDSKKWQHLDAQAPSVDIHWRSDYNHHASSSRMSLFCGERLHWLEFSAETGSIALSGFIILGGWFQATMLLNLPKDPKNFHLSFIMCRHMEGRSREGRRKTRGRGRSCHGGGIVNCLKHGENFRIARVHFLWEVIV